MSIQFRTEILTGTLAGEIERLGIAHGEEFTYHREAKGPLQIDWGYYFTLCSQGLASFFIARDGDKLIGYVVNYIGRNRHYVRATCLSDDTFYLAREYRGTRIGIQFLLEAEKERELSKATILRWVNKAKSDYAPLWEKMGYVPEEIHYTKVNPQREIV